MTASSRPGTSAQATPWTVERFDLGNPADVVALEQLRGSGRVDREEDGLPEALEELFRLDVPSLAPGSPAYAAELQRYLDARWNGGDVGALGVWVHLPWRRGLVHLPAEPDFFRLRTARNQILVTPEEQAAFSRARVGVGGLSVGQSVVTTMVLSGGAGRVRIADDDTLGLTNLNRLPASVTQLGVSKTTLCAQRLLELNPFQEVQVFGGLSAGTLDAFFGSGTERLDLFVEEMDDVAMKVATRFAARARGIPVLMATDAADAAIVDVERFDLEPERPLFHGRVADATLRDLPAEPSVAQRVDLIAAIMGTDLGRRTELVLREVGQRIPQWSQLATGATLAGAALTYTARRILSGQAMPSGRYRVDLDALLGSGIEAPLSRPEPPDWAP
ncbi:MAG: hypothetical protein JWN46_1430 [Acidimicrobiales bacterium]|nr:hypothetical protein [Acidimicrobiales bacterium]